MKITNKHNIPEPLYNAIDNDDYAVSLDRYLRENNIPDDRHVSCTSLIGSPRQFFLKKRHWDELSEDAMDCIWRLLGSAVHQILEYGAEADSMVEQRLHTKFNGWYTSAQSDYFTNTAQLWDYKVTSAYSVVFDPDGKREWEKQLWINYYLWKKAGFEVKGLGNCLILRDWSQTKAKYDADYPDHQCVTVTFPIPTMAEVEHYIKGRLQLFSAYFGVPDDNLLYCTPDECWERPTKYAVKKKGNKKASKLFDDYSDAKAYTDSRKGNYEINKRVGKRVKCERYCSVSEFCNQYTKWKEDNK